MTKKFGTLLAVTLAAAAPVAAHPTAQPPRAPAKTAPAKPVAKPATKPVAPIVTTRPRVLPSGAPACGNVQSKMPRPASCVPPERK